MKNVFSLRKRSFLSPVSTGFTSHIFAEVESSNEGEYRWGHNMLTIADCRYKTVVTCAIMVVTVIPRFSLLGQASDIH